MNCLANRTRRSRGTLLVSIFVFSFSFNTHAQIIGTVVPDDFSGSLAKGDEKTGFGFSALRYEDKQRMKRLRERYLDLNPKNKGIIEVYDVETFAEDDMKDKAEVEAESALGEPASPESTGQTPAAE